MYFVFEARLGVDLRLVLRHIRKRTIHRIAVLIASQFGVSPGKPGMRLQAWRSRSIAGGCYRS